MLRHPYDVGDRIAVSDVNSPAPAGGSPGWVVKDIDLFTTTYVSPLPHNFRLSLTPPLQPCLTFFYLFFAIVALLWILVFCTVQQMKLQRTRMGHWQIQGLSIWLVPRRPTCTFFSSFPSIHRMRK